ncbi:MAG TPA: hypothetical protein VJV22_19925 [Acidobacteriaceae bacterium]|nr:hypothetical protein [Acidobacteriaceae bacterium]
MGNGHGGADAEFADCFAARALEGGLGFGGETRTFAGVAKEGGAGVGETDAPFAAVEEDNAQLFFEGVNLLADRGLAEVQALGGVAKAGFFGDGSEDAEPEIFHGRALLLYWFAESGACRGGAARLDFAPL